MKFPVDITFHYPPDLMGLLIEVIPALCKGLAFLRKLVGAVSFVQFFGSALQVTPNFHSLVPDGVIMPHITGGVGASRMERKPGIR